MPTHKREGHKLEDRKQLSLSMPYSCIGDGSSRIGKPEFIVQGLVGSPLSLALSLSQPACDDLDFQHLTLPILYDQLNAQGQGPFPLVFLFG